MDLGGLGASGLDLWGGLAGPWLLIWVWDLRVGRSQEYLGWIWEGVAPSGVGMGMGERRV